MERFNKNSYIQHKKITMNDVLIDEGISELIQTLWDNEMETFQCCQGGHELLKEDGRFSYCLDDKIFEKAHLIFNTDHIEEIKKFLPEDVFFIIGDINKKGVFEEWLGGFNATWASFKHN